MSQDDTHTEDGYEKKETVKSFEEILKHFEAEVVWGECCLKEKPNDEWSKGYTKAMKETVDVLKQWQQNILKHIDAFPVERCALIDGKVTELSMNVNEIQWLKKLKEVLGSEAKTE